MLTSCRAGLAVSGVRWASGSMWSHVPQAPPDAILGVGQAFLKEKRPEKVNLSVGAYRDADGKPMVLECVKRAEKALIHNPPGHEYLPIAGLESFCRGAREIALGKDGSNCDHSCIATVQALSGTGSLRIAAEFLHKWYPKKDVPFYLPNPTWGNHKKVFGESGFKDIRAYRYFDPKTGGVNVAGMLEDIRNAPEGSIFLFHACAHNPTGADPSRADWETIRDACADRNHVVVFDSAYQGFASGDPERDANALRLFALRGAPPMMLLCQSFAKNLGLYGERVGALSVLCGSASEAARVKSQLEQVIRPMYSSPPAWGARLAAAVLTNEELTQLWIREMAGMAARIDKMRYELVEALNDVGSTRNWMHIKKQIGMFSYTGLTRPQCEAMTRDHAIYLTMDGRISMAGINYSNVQRVARAIHKVVSSDY